MATGREGKGPASIVFLFVCGGCLAAATAPAGRGGWRCRAPAPRQDQLRVRKAVAGDSGCRRNKFPAQPQGATVVEPLSPAGGSSFVVRCLEGCEDSTQPRLILSLQTPQDPRPVTRGEAGGGGPQTPLLWGQRSRVKRGRLVSPTPERQKQAQPSPARHCEAGRGASAPPTPLSPPQ